MSDERDQLLGTGGGAVRALSQLGAAPFYHALGYEDSATYLRKLLPGRG